MVSAAARAYRRAVADHALEARFGWPTPGLHYDSRAVDLRPAFPEGDVVVVLQWWRAAKRGDLDGRIKVVLDALQGVAYTNDKQVAGLTMARGEDPERPRLEVEVHRAPHLVRALLHEWRPSLARTPGRAAP